MCNNIISWLTNADIESTRYYAASCRDVPTLQRALEIERTYKRRKGAIQILERRIKQLTKKGGCDSPLYAPLRDMGWDMLTVEVTCSAAGRTRTSGLQGDGHVKENQRRTECIWRNPEALRRIAAQSK